MYRHGFKSTSNSDKLLAHTVKINLAYILFKNIFDKMMRKAKNCKIHVQKRPNYIIKSNFEFGIYLDVLSIWPCHEFTKF